MRKFLPALLLAATAVLAACGGSPYHDEPAAPAPPATPSGGVPPGATASIQAFVAFVAGLLPSETASPLNVDAAVPPLSESAEPRPLG